MSASILLRVRHLLHLPRPLLATRRPLDHPHPETLHPPHPQRQDHALLLLQRVRQPAGARARGGAEVERQGRVYEGRGAEGVVEGGGADLGDGSGGAQSVAGEWMWGGGEGEVLGGGAGWVLGRREGGRRGRDNGWEGVREMKRKAALVVGVELLCEDELTEHLLSD